MVSPWEIDVGPLEIRKISLAEDEYTLIPEEPEGDYMPTPEEIAEMHENEVLSVKSPDKPSESTTASITNSQVNNQPESSSTVTETSLPVPEEPIAAEITSNPSPEPETNSSLIKATSNHNEDIPPLEEFPLAPNNNTTTKTYALIPENLAYLSESWNALTFATEYANHLFFRAETGHGQNWIDRGWYVWDSGRWTSSSSHTVVNRMMMTITQMSKIANECYCKDDLKVINAHIKKSLSRASIWNALQIASNSPTLNVKASRLDSNPLLLNLKNGTLDTENLKLRAHDPRDYITKQIPIELKPEAVCPRWNQFIAEITCGDTALADYIQRAAGYSITGDTSEQIMFVLLGTGNNGKSLFLKVLRDILGDYAKQGTLDLLTSMGTPDGDKANNAVASLQGAYMITLSETRQNARLQENLVKQLTGGDPVTARNLYENFFEFVPRFKLWLATNHRPVIGDTGIGMWRRLKLIPFNAVIQEDAIDPHLYEKLMSEAPGILAWLVEGLKQWHLRGLKADEPPAVTLGTQEYKKEMDKVALFLDECIENDDTLTPEMSLERITSKAMYTIYTTWCIEVGEKPLSQRYLSIRLKEKGLILKKSNGDAFWIGVKKRTT